MTQEAGNQPSKEEVVLLPVSEMEKMSHSELYLARQKAKTPEEQKHIAPYEHRAFAREYTAENPVTGAIGLAAAIPLYQAYKAVGSDSRTGVQMQQVGEGYKGIGEGLSKAIVEPWKRVWNNPEEMIQNAPRGLEAKPKPWEKVYPAEQAVSAPKGVNRSAAEKQMAIDAQLTPAQEARGDRYDLSDANLNELQTEIDSSSGSNREILQAEMDKLMKKKAKK